MLDLRASVVLAFLMLAPACGDGGAGGRDARAGGDAGGDGPAAGGDGAVAGRCTTDLSEVRCTYELTELEAAGLARQVYWQVPVGTAPAAGWPAVVVYQGSTVSSERTFVGLASDDFGIYHQVQTTRALLDAGYAVIAPRARAGTFWDTNLPIFAAAWESAPDHALVVAVLAGIDAGTYGPIDATRLHAAGLSSGGYMTSRMAVSYPGTFRSLAIVAASYATCAAALCLVPALPDDHPPTLFLHGDADPIVPVATMETYRDALVADGVTVRAVIEPGVGHGWTAMGPIELPAWFAAHP